jgi:hypothetical protein
VALLSRRPQPEDGPALAEALTVTDRRARRQAHAALRRLTHQPVDGDPDAPAAARGLAERWRAFFRQHGGAGALAWLALGLQAHGVPLARPGAIGWGDVPALLEALRRRDAKLADSAEQALASLRGARVKGRSLRARAGAWRRWWRAERRAQTGGAASTETASPAARRQAR